MHLLLFRTDIGTKKKVKTVKTVFKHNHVVTSCSVDINDIDNVLRIESTGRLKESDVIGLMHSCGFYCEVLPD